MKIVFHEFTGKVAEVASNNNGCRQALRRLQVGSPPTPRSWFWEQKRPEWILSSVESMVKAMRDQPLIAEWDLAKASKFQPQGESAPLAERLDGFEEYFSHLDSPPIIKTNAWKEAKRQAIIRLGLNEQGHPYTASEVMLRGLSEDKYDTNSGFPLYKKRKSPDAKQHVIDHWHDPEVWTYPFTLGTRATMGKTGVNARNIFMASMDVNVHGQVYAIAFQDYLRTLCVRRRNPIYFFLPWEGWDRVQTHISKNWDGTLKFGTDYDKYDQYFNLHHGLECYDVIKHYFNRSHWEELRHVIEHVFDASVLTNLGLVTQRHSMPSGSEWTNLLETVWDYIWTIYLELTLNVPLVTGMGIGDDQLLFFGVSSMNQEQIEDLTKRVVESMEMGGLQANVEKQEVGYRETSFLQRHCTTDWAGPNGQTRAAGVYSLVRNVTSQTYPERYHNDATWNKYKFAIRVIMICENCVMHPKFEEYVLFCWKSNDALSELVALKPYELQKEVSEAKGIPGFIPTYNQEKRDKPLVSFETYRVMRQLLERNK